MMYRGPEPRKLDEALTWRENDDLARTKAQILIPKVRKMVEGTL